MMVNGMCYFWESSSILPPSSILPSSWTEWIWANTWHFLWLEEPLGTEDQHCLSSQVCLYRIAYTEATQTSKPTRLVIIWPVFSRGPIKFPWVANKNREVGSQLHLSSKKGLYSPLSRRARVGGLSVTDNIKKIRNSQCGTQMLNIPSLVSANKSL